ncbi:sphingosine 1-phosphate receptor 5 [Hemicordylus capensis]|uniref:sphingosine 1-phosphate receptor 5 n=1 Tax=Hemicordylus capensis TaxID=884348 RepID=UPI002303944B|nr:sphingosine 1-phosphate receptor 5 [Hemicordylus capensis]XP_053145890.1 sphingosine 1-phosphate receptor 5 [Hemicordylus capensis]XP_053145891.1 sphingosine 1-phosphate receptor 5 [Hemicordylus capensis]XP_053145892.1 sphingosine 1-phosphate receptor 5 [Hemicordylus capensis]XP_053145893.1 sphingosine 1-phosphate receptor 5 [Hemicordylus capensis]XP_053145894.1 sphingosine 1-phosphate receptor 5 [Hemicordylus capensis]
MESSPSLIQMYWKYYNSNIISLHYNYTGKLQASSKYKGSLKADAIIFLVVCAFIVVENLVVLLAIWRNKKFHSPMYYLLGNLTLSDLLAGVAYTANIIMSGASTLKLTPAQWFLREGGVFVTLAASVLSLLAIAIERHITMIRMRLYHGDKKGRMFLLAGASWVVSILLGVLPILGWNCIDNLPECSIVLPLYSKHYILFCITIFLVILISIVVLYVRIYRMVKFNGQRLGSLRKGMLKKSQKYMALLKTVTIVVGTFIVCWLPLFLLLLLDVACQARDCSMLYKADYFLGLAMINSLLNPIIYTLTSKDMRRAILRLLCCLLVSTPGAEESRGKRFGLPILEGSTSKSERSSHQQEGLHASLSVTNGIPTAIKALVPKTAH